MASQDQWKVLGDDRAKHDGQFFKLKPVNGFITGEQARGFFIQSGLPTPVLGHIWGLADMNNDGKMDKKEFSIAMFLIKKKLQGYELPKLLPASLKADPSPLVTSLASSPMHMAMAGQGMAAQMGHPSGIATLPPGMSPSMIAPHSTPFTMPRGTMNGLPNPPYSMQSTPGMPAGFGVSQTPGNIDHKPRSDSYGRMLPPPSPAAGVGGGATGDWAMPHPNKLKYTQVFNTHDHNKRGHLTGVEARSLLMQSSLPQNILAQVWNLADYDKDGKLTCEEFCIAMFMIDQSKAGRQLPVTLPVELMPTKLRSGSGSVQGVGLGGAQTGQMAGYQTQQQPLPAADSFGDLLGGFGQQMPPLVATGTGDMKAEESAMQLAATFEDKRKQNFDKGQAELEKRRQALQDQLRKEEEARVEKERREMEQREQQRLERERRKQYELDKQMEKQRELERQREEQRQKMLEQREAARRELERQRQMEWERQRKEQLMGEKMREGEQLAQIKSQNTNLRNELEGMDAKKVELTQKISQVRSSATDVTSSIERMRQSRDLKMADIERFQNSLQELSYKYTQNQKEREQLSIKVQTAINNNPVYDMHRTLSNGVEMKKSSIERLKQQLADIEKATASKLADIDSSNTSLSQLNQKVSELEEKVKTSKLSTLATLMDTRPSSTPLLNGTASLKETAKVPWFDTNDIKTDATSSSSWGFEMTSTPSTQPDSSGGPNWTAAFGSNAFPQPSENADVTSRRYQAMYQFEARNSDEISLNPGDVVMCNMDKGVEPGWMYGECNGTRGCFPEAFVQEVGEEVDTAKVSSPTAIDWSESQPSMSPGMSGDVFAMNSEEDSIPVSPESSFIPVQTPTSPPRPMQGERAPLGLTAQALYPWKAKKDNHLTFNKGDTIVVTVQQDMWWSGEINGAEGWFPKSYVKLISGPTNASSSEPVTTHPGIPTTLVKDHVPENLLYVAMFTYQSEEPTDLTFNQGEIIEVVGQEGDWWMGKIGARSGMFPANYVKSMEGQGVADSQRDEALDSNIVMEERTVDTSDLADAAGTLFSQSSPTDSDVSMPPAPISFETSLKTNKKPEIATVIAAYAATGNEQLSLHQGQLIHVRRKNPSGWWQGELQARGQKKKIGWFPADYVKLLGSTSARSTPDMMRGSSPAHLLQEPVRTATPSPVNLPPHLAAADVPQQKYVDQVVALYAYDAQNSEELSFLENSVINVLSKDANWWVGELNGAVGIFPSNYVRALDAQPDSGTYQQVTTPEENKRRSAIQELIDTEEIYMSDMSIVLDVFYNPLSERGLNKDELQAMFVNWSELILCNTKLLQSLRVRKKMCSQEPAIQNIGDILCENLPHLSPYIRYCSCQLNAAALLQHKTETSHEFKDSHKKCVTDPRAKGMPLSSYLLKPMQRITKYPLIIKKILSHTSEDHSDHQNLVDALAKAEELCSQVNEGVREKENSDRLEWMQYHVQCDGLPEKVIFNSMTNCLGPRKVIYSATVYKAKSNKELVAFLFNDFLLLTQPIRALGSIVQVFNFDAKTNTQYRMYKTPIFLNEVIVKHASDDETDTSMFVILHIDHIYTLKAVNSNERDAWMRHIETCSRFYLETERKKREKAYTTDTSKGSVGRVLVIICEGINLKISADTVRRTTSGVGRLLIVVLEANDLRVSDDGKSDPYCEVSIGSQEHKTKVISGTNNPKWNSSMQFTIKDIQQDVLCITVYDRDLFTPNDFLGRTEVRLANIHHDTSSKKGPITKRLLLHEVDCGEVLVKIDIQMFEE